MNDADHHNFLAADDFEGLDTSDVANHRADLGARIADDKCRFRFMTDEELDNLPLPDWLVEGLIVGGSFVVIAGAPGAMKSFLALDLAACIRTGTAWAGRAVKAGAVVYLLAEGKGLFSLRIRAWKQHHQTHQPMGIQFLMRPVQLVERSDVSGFIEAIQALPEQPVLIIIDTLARCAVGMDENSAEEMGQLVAGADRIREAIGATVMLLHHTPRGEERERGSAALRAATDTLIVVSVNRDVVTVAAKRQKDIDEGAPLLFCKHIVELEDGRTSCVLVPTTAQRQQALVGPAEPPRSIRTLLDALSVNFPNRVRLAELRGTTGLKDRTFYDALAKAQKLKFVEKHSGNYRLTLLGRERLG